MSSSSGVFAKLLAKISDASNLEICLNKCDIVDLCDIIDIDERSLLLIEDCIRRKCIKMSESARELLVDKDFAKRPDLFKFAPGVRERIFSVVDALKKICKNTQIMENEELMNKYGNFLLEQKKTHEICIPSSKLNRYLAANKSVFGISNLNSICFNKEQPVKTVTSNINTDESNFIDLTESPQKPSPSAVKDSRQKDVSFNSKIDREIKSETQTNKMSDNLTICVVDKEKLKTLSVVSETTTESRVVHSKFGTDINTNTDISRINLHSKESKINSLIGTATKTKSQNLHSDSIDSQRNIIDKENLVMKNSPIIRKYNMVLNTYGVENVPKKSKDIDYSTINKTPRSNEQKSNNKPSTSSRKEYIKSPPVNYMDDKKYATHNQPVGNNNSPFYSNFKSYKKNPELAPPMEINSSATVVPERLRWLSKRCIPQSPEKPQKPITCDTSQLPRAYQMVDLPCELFLSKANSRPHQSNSRFHLIKEELVRYFSKFIMKIEEDYDLVVPANPAETNFQIKCYMCQEETGHVKKIHFSTSSSGKINYANIRKHVDLHIRTHRRRYSDDQLKRSHESRSDLSLSNKKFR